MPLSPAGRPEGPSAKRLTRHARAAPHPPTRPNTSLSVGLKKSAALSRTQKHRTDHLNHAGQRTASGRPFDEDTVRWLRWHHRIPSPSPFTDNELGVHELAQRLNVGDHVIYVWIRQGKLQARRVGQRRLAIRFNADIEAACRQRLADSPRTRYLNQQPVDGGAE